MSNIKVFLLAVVLCCLSISLVQACESQCRTEPVDYLVNEYKAILNYQAKTLTSKKSADTARKLIPKIVSRLQGRHMVIDKTIFSTYRGSCAPAGVGKRSPDELCGSAKSIACYAPWDHKRNGQPMSVLASVHDAVGKEIEKIYQQENIKDVKVFRAMVTGVKAYCPGNCNSWVKPFQTIMLGWEKTEHPLEYGENTPNCLSLGMGGI
ncbi:hypothetical protein BGZ65_008563 [Modicella reniformis]|uniref:Uncharacterized protein n=1 Tax=Modicella reniformis TaxID=1440133 RepID=A0A9P6SP05_9FUNG|nr:hypothetical protein BGZ65_008563 [Modicella reniformis]